MKPAALLTKDGNIEIDLAHLLDYATPEAETLYAKLAGYAAFEEAFVTRLVDHIATGATEDGDWWSSELAEKVRSRLLPMVDGAVAELIADLVHSRDRAVAMSERWRNACWQIADQWEQMDRERCRKAQQPDYHVARTMTAEEAREWMANAEAKARGES